MRLRLSSGVGIVLCGIAWALAGTGPNTVQPAPGEARAAAERSDNAFARANPGYKERAGAFYEKEYLGKALDQLAKAAELTDERKTAARKILRTFIDDWLESYVSGGGHINSENLAHCLALMDERFQGELSQAGHKAYLAWRKDETGGSNALAFLMNPRFAVRRIPAATPERDDASRPEANRTVDWGRAAATVLPMLLKRSLLELSDELAANIETADAETLIVSLDVFLRAGEAERVSEVIPLLGKAAGIGRPDGAVAERLLKQGWHEQARLWFDTFFTWCPSDAEMKPFLTWMAEKEGQAATEAWLRAKSQQEQETHRYWGGQWSRLYWHQLAAWGKLSAYVASLRQGLQDKPDDVGLAFAYLGARAALSEAERPSPAWLAEALRLEHALDNFVLARWFASERDYTAAVHFYDKSLACRVTDYDRQWFNAASMSSMYVPAAEVETVLRRWAKAGLAKACFQDRRLDRAQKLVEELTGKKDGTLEDLGPYLFAGQVQAASGQRVVEGRIKEAEKEQKDSVRYWLNRARYYLGRKEKEQAEQAYQSAMKLPADSFRWEVVGDYGVFMEGEKRYKDAERLYRDEIARVGVPSAEFWLSRLTGLHGKGGVQAGWDEPLVWSWLKAQKAAGFHQAGQMWLERLARQADDWAAFERKARELAGDAPPPALQYCLGRILYRHSASREAAEMMTSAYGRWPRDAYPPARRAGDDVLRVLLEQADSKAAEAVADGLLKDPQCGLDPRWLGGTAVEAAGHGALDLAMRLWERKAALDLTDQEGLEALAAAGLRARLAEFYGGLSQKAPNNKAVEAALAKLRK
ncbi:MAG TPA: hypothetical protein VNA25_27215 [Phycisphaerae bacterium]|nr:hypothetical protein [Phycisphaerae bacterium]